MITKEEYELLKYYRATGYGWIARDRDECVYVYKSKPIKLGLIWGDNERGCSEWSLNDGSLPCIKWEDEKPTKIDDLIKDYESHQEIVGESVNKAELMKEIEDILDDIGVSDYQLGECDEDTIWTISSITIRKIFSTIEKHSLDGAKAWLDGYEVSEESLYYALIKGHELLNSKFKYWGCKAYNSGDLLICGKHPTYNINRMTQNNWNRLGINESNAEFIKVEEIK